jgi:hypothetical protein
LINIKFFESLVFHDGSSINLRRKFKLRGNPSGSHPAEYLRDCLISCSDISGDEI